MAIDWERVIVESDDNGVVVSAGQVSLLIGADADSVSWGNITGDITQQPDLMQIVDGYVSADSPTFTGTPRSVTPPEGNDSTRIATTAFVQGEMANVRRDVSGKVNEAPVNNHIWGRKDENWAQLGEMATVDEPHSGGHSGTLYHLRAEESDGDYRWHQAGVMALKDKVSNEDLQHPTDIYVDARNGNDDTGTGKIDAPYQTIGKAIQEASDIYQTTIMIEAGQYTPRINITKSIWLYSLAEGNNSVEIEEIGVDGARLDLYGQFTIGQIQANNGATIIHQTGGQNKLVLSGNYQSPIKADNGTKIAIDTLYIKTNNIGTLLTAENASIIAVQKILSNDSNNKNVNRIATADAGFIMVGQFDDISTADNPRLYHGGLVMLNGLSYNDLIDLPVLGSLAKYDVPPENYQISTLKKYAMVTDQRDGHMNSRWELIDEPPGNNSTLTKYYLRTSYADIGVDSNGENYIYYKNEWEEFPRFPQPHEDGTHYVLACHMHGTPPNETYTYEWERMN